MAGELDLKIVNGDLDFGPDDEPVFLEGADVIAQDVGTRVRASGLPVELIADDGDPADTIKQITFEVEKDERVRAGSTKSTLNEDGSISIVARTIAGETVTA